MSSNPQRLQYLFQQYLHDKGTSDELNEFWKLFAELDEEDDPVKNDLWELWYSDSKNQSIKDWENTLKQIHLRAESWEKKQPSNFLRISFWRVAAAASIILALGIGAYFLLSNRPTIEFAKNITKDNLIKNDILPGGNKAILTLANGKIISLSSASNGVLVQQGNAKVIKLNNGQLFYENSIQSSSNRDKSIVMQYNTLTTPRGGQFNVTLPDGSQVWLNSASSLHYPMAFFGKERKVEITGEAYFEVAHNADKPFIVTVNGTQVQVLGTHFNINAYNDEPIMKTTLLEGSIKFTSKNDTRVLLPGQQIQVESNGEIMRIKEADLAQTIAWKNGTFSFHNTSINEIMRQVSRWYDVDVNFQDSMHVYLNGNIKRNVKVSEVLKMIELTGEVNFKIEGKKITVMK